MARPLLALVVVLTLLLAGCTVPGIPPPPAKAPDQRVILEAYVVPALNLSVDSPSGHVRATGRALAVPLQYEGQALGAVYVGAESSYRFDAIFAARGRTGFHGDFFVQAPSERAGSLRTTQGWEPASAADLAAFGIVDNATLFARAAHALPGNQTPPTPGMWAFNGTFQGRVNASAFVLGTEEGPFVFQRDVTGFVIVENRTLIRWAEENQTITASNDALLQVKLFDRAVAQVRELTWSASSLIVTVQVPHFNEADLVKADETAAQTATVKLPGAAEIDMVKFTVKDYRNGFAQLRSPNITATLTEF